MKYQAEIWINATPERVYEVLSDVEKMYVFDPEVKSVTITSEIKRGVGVRSHWVAEKNGVKKEWNETVTTYDPPRAFGFRVESETRLTEGYHELFPEKNGTRLRITENHIKGGYDPKLSPERMRKGLEKIKKWAEQS